MSEDKTKQVKDERKRYDERRAEMAEAVDPKDVQKKAADDEALSLEELQAVNVPPERPHNDEAEIGKRYEGSDYAPAAQPDLSAPAYVLARQAKLAADGKDDTRVGATADDMTDEEKKDAEDRREEVAAKKAAAKKTS
jgi:hypothetical protein